MKNSNRFQSFLRRTGEFILIVCGVLVLQLIFSRYAQNHMNLEASKVAETLLATFTSALTLLLSTWVAYRIAYAKQHQDSAMRRKENVMTFYNDTSSADFAKLRKEANEVFHKYSLKKNIKFDVFFRDEGQVSESDRAAVHAVLLLFRKLHLGLENHFFDLDAVVNCFGDEIVIWYDVWLKKALNGLGWPSEHAVEQLRKIIVVHASDNQLEAWKMEARQMLLNKK